MKKPISLIILTGLLLIYFFFYSVTVFDPNSDKNFRSGETNATETEEENSRFRSSMLILQRFKELGKIIDGRFNKIETTFGNQSNHSRIIRNYKEDIQELYHLLQQDILGMKEIKDSLKLREHKLRNVTKYIHNRIHQSQFPSNCADRKKLMCNPAASCGVGCSLHFLVYCLLVGFATDRVVMDVSDAWPFWNEVFLPLTNCSYDKTLNKNRQDDTLYLTKYEPYQYPYPKGYPKEYNDYLSLSDSPMLFWISHFVNFVMRPSKNFSNHIEKEAARLEFQKPIAGIHVRRTDKLRSEGRKFDLEEYMIHVSHWYDSLEAKNWTANSTRRVFLMTDDVSVMKETSRKSPKYKFFSDEEATERAKVVSHTRVDYSSFLDVVTNIFILSKCDFVVCTMTSNICRFVAELTEIFKHCNDSHGSFVSLDMIYHFIGVSTGEAVVLTDHNPDSFEQAEIQLKVGDIIQVIWVFDGEPLPKNKFDGYMFGKNLRTGAIGQFPRYKAQINE